MEDHLAPITQKKKRKMQAKIIFIAAIFVVGGSAACFFSSSARNVAENGVAIAIRSWQSVFGASQSDYSAADIDDLDENASDTLLAGDESTTSAGDLAMSTPKNLPEENISQKPSPKKTTAKKTVVVENSSANDQIKNMNDAQPPTDTFLESSVDEENISSTSSVPLPPPTCTIATNADPSGKIIVNEVAWMGSPLLAGESASAASNREWIEIKNRSADTLNLSGWQVTDSAGNIKIIFSDGDTIASGSFLLLERGEDAVPGVTADKIYSGGLSNAGDVLAIFDPTCAMSDLVDASDGWPAGNNTTKQTLERDADGIGWHTSASPGGTPRVENSIVAVPPPSIIDPAPQTEPSANPPTPTASSSDQGENTTTTVSSSEPLPPSTTTTTPLPTSTIVIGHPMIAAVQIAGASSSNDFVKIYDPTVSNFDMTGWKLRKKSSTGTDSSLREFPDGSVLAPGEYFIWANGAGGFGDSIAANVTSTETLAADNSVALLDASGTIVDEVAWGTGTDQYVEGDAFPTDPTANQILTRKILNGAMTDTDDNTNDFSIQ
jgi:hypothetical protein